MYSTKKVVAGLLVAPLFPAVVAALLAGTRGAEFDADTASSAAFACLFGGYVAAFFIGFPLSFVWRRFGWTKIVGGIALGMISAAGITLAAYLMARPLRHSDVSFLSGLMNLLTFTTPVGCIGGLALWWFGFRNCNDNLEGDARNASGPN